MKTIAVIGAGGKSGRLFVAKALTAGYIVKAAVHRSNPFKSQEKLETYTMDATNTTDVARLLQDVDIVVSLIGHTKHSPHNVQTNAMNVVVAEMKRQSISKIVSLTGTGVRFPGDTISFIDKIMNISIARIDPDRIQDGIEHGEVLEHSGLDWTIVRVLKLTNQNVEHFSLSSSGPGKVFVSRNAVANAILEILHTNSYSKSAPIITS